LEPEWTGDSEMTAFPHELRIDECRRLIADGGVGRVAFQSRSGQHIVPVNFELDRDSIVFRTTPYSELGRLAPGSEAAFEVEGLDVESTSGWSVVAKGRVERVPDNFETAAIRCFGKDPTPWAEGIRRMYLKLTWRELTGRRLAAPWWLSSPSSPAVASSTGPRAPGSQAPLLPDTPAPGVVPTG
jgi:uncharacterized protein